MIWRPFLFCIQHFTDTSSNDTLPRTIRNNLKGTRKFAPNSGAPSVSVSPRTRQSLANDDPRRVSSNPYIVTWLGSLPVIMNLGCSRRSHWLELSAWYLAVKWAAPYVIAVFTETPIKFCEFHGYNVHQQYSTLYFPSNAHKVKKKSRVIKTF